MFDAGAIEAKLTVDTSAADRSLDEFKAKVEKFEHDGHKVKIAAVFDSGSMDRARKMFSDLDNAISKDAMNRLRSSPQGSVLGSLNALFSPHPVTGAPSPSQSAQGGLLGKMLSPTSSGSTVGGGGGSSPLADALAQNAYTTDDIRQNLTGNGPGDTTTTDDIRQALIGQGAQNTTTTDDIRQALVGQGPANTTTTDDIKQALIGTGATNTTTTDDIKQALVGTGATNVTTTDTIRQAVVGAGPKNTSTTDTVREKLDPASEAKTEAGAKASGDRSGASFMGMFTSHIKNLLPKSATDDLQDKSKESGDSAGQALGSGLLSGMGPSILGVGAKEMFGKLVLIAVGGLSVLPALAGIIGTGMGVAMVGGLLAVAISGNAKLKAQFSGLGGDFKTVISNAVAPIVPVVSKAISSLTPIIKSLQGPLTSIFKEIGPQIAGVFAGLGPIITGLLGVMKAAAPAFGPFIGALEKLAGNLFPGIATVVKATIPFISQLAGILGGLGGNLGALFAAAAPAVGASMKILGGLLDLIGGLLPVIMKLADIFAVTLAPVFTAFAGVVATLIKPLTLIGSVIAQFAGAVIGDLASAFGAVATLIKAIGPGLGVLAAAFGSLFTVLENSGVFAEVGDALENIAPALGKLIALLITDIAPVLPTIVDLFAQLVTVIVDLASGALGVIVTGFTNLVNALPVGVVQALVGGFIALKLAMMGFEGFGVIFGAITTAITALGGALSLDDIIIAAYGALANLMVIADTAWAAAQVALDAVTGVFTGLMTALDGVLIANPIGVIIIAVAALGAAIYLLVANWSTVWGTIKDVAKDAWDFLTTGWGQFIFLPLTAIIDAVKLVSDNWTAIWGAIQAAAADAWNFIFNGIGKYLLVLLGPGGAIVLGLIELYQHWGTIWGEVKTVAADIWTWLSTVFGTDLVRFFTVTIPGWLTELLTDATNFGAKLLVPYKAIWTWLSGTFGPDLVNFFTATIPGWFDRLIALVGSHFVTPFQNAIKGAWTWVTTNVFDKMEAFFTTTLPGWFDTAVGAIGKFWDGLQNTVSKPVTWVLTNVVDPLFGAIDDVTSWVGGGRPLPANLATGGKLPGYGGGDIVPALLEPGETVVDKDKSRQFGWLFKLMGVPGYAAGGIVGGGVDVLKILGDLATGNLGAAGRALLSATGTGGALGQLATTLADVPATMVTDAVKYLVKDAIAALLPVKGYQLSASASQVMALMKSMAAGRGWTGDQWVALNAVEMAEAGYNLRAVNPTSGAYGIAQFINGPSEYADYGGNANTAAGQITGMLNYITQRYSNPVNAWAHESEYHWYGQGGMITEPVIGYGMNSGRGYVFGESGSEMVTPIGKGGGVQPITDGLSRLEGKLDNLITVGKQAPAATGQHVSSAIGGAAHAASMRSRYPRGGS